MSCLIIGDSIAKGVADIRKDCKSYTQVGIRTAEWAGKWLHKIDFMGDRVFISLGSNDDRRDMDRVADELHRIRFYFEGGLQVYWVLPANKNWVRELVLEVAGDYGDVVMEIPDLSRDGIHPTPRGYRGLAGAF